VQKYAKIFNYANFSDIFCFLLHFFADFLAYVKNFS